MGRDDVFECMVYADELQQVEGCAVFEYLDEELDGGENAS